ncbi:MAG TPA: adenylate/guanylate cyclase domain-containing protein [Candidatus Obscuribacterales bacterium]
MSADETTKSGSITVLPETPSEYSLDLLEGEVLAIGRKPSQSDKRKLILPFPEVSGQHAEIRCKPDGWTIVDSGSTNGTMINGARLTPGREYILHSGDRVKIAQYDLIVQPPVNGPRELEEERDEQDKTQFRIHLINATILVGDIVGFSTLMERYAAEPDLVMRAQQTVFEALNEEIHRNYGQLEKIAGDAIMAYWSGDDSKEGAGLQAYQACYTALEMRTLAQKLGKDRNYWPFQGHPLVIDMALATGPVAAGTLGQAGGSQAITGDTANVVFRLEKLISDAHAGEIWVDGVTHDLAKDRFRFKYVGQFSVKGRQRPVDVYQLLNLN